MYKIVAIFFMVFLVSNLYARQNYSERGIRTYKKLCKKCHGSPYKGAAMLRTKEWKKLFKKGDAKILAIHMKSEKAVKVFETSYYKNRRRHLVKFLVSSASDSGVVSGCDGNYCGE